MFKVCDKIDWKYLQFLDTRSIHKQNQQIQQNQQQNLHKIKYTYIKKTIISRRFEV